MFKNVFAHTPSRLFILSNILFWLMLNLVVSLIDGNLNARLVNKASTRVGHQGFGIGLQNCRKRLKHIYKRKKILQCQEIDNGYFGTLLCLPAGVTDV